MPVFLIRKKNSWPALSITSLVLDCDQITAALKQAHCTVVLLSNAKVDSSHLVGCSLELVYSSGPVPNEESLPHSRRFSSY